MKFSIILIKVEMMFECFFFFLRILSFLLEAEQIFSDELQDGECAVGLAA